MSRVNDTGHVKGRLRPLAGKDFSRFEQDYCVEVSIHSGPRFLRT